MSARKNFFFRQRVSEAELDSAFDDLEQADHHLAGDLGFVGILANAVVSPHAPVPNLTVDVSGPGTALDQLGQRIFFSGLQSVNVAQDDNGVATEVSAANKERVVSIFVMFDRTLSDPRVDGNSQTVFFQRDESFKFVVAQSAEAPAGEAVPPALRSDAILLADVVRRFEQAQIGGDTISTARRQDAFVLSGAPRAIRRGLTKEAVADLLGFYNAHVAGTADRHPAAAIDYAGGNAAWADGGQNPATTVEAQIDKIIADLAAEGGSAKIGAAATAGTPRALGAGSVKSQLDALLGFVNGHITAAAGAHAASAITYGGGGAWKDGTANPAATLEAQLDKLVVDLSADAGAARIGTGARADWLDGRTNPAGVSVLTALSKIIADLSERAEATDGAARIGAHTSGTLPAGSVRSQLDALNASAVRTNAANVFSETQTINGTADEKVAALATTTAPGQRKLLWEIAGQVNVYKYRLYAELHTLEITVNARWDGAQWVKDTAALPSSKLELNGTNFRLNSSESSNAPVDDIWPNTIDVQMSGHGKQSFDPGANWTSSGATETYIGWRGSSSNIQSIGAAAPFRKMFPVTPSSITFVLVASQRISTAPVAFATTTSGTGAVCSVAAFDADVFFFARVIAS
jgi:hypothetical protein